MTLISRPQWWLKPNLPEKRDTEEGEGGTYIKTHTHCLCVDLTSCKRGRGVTVLMWTRCVCVCLCICMSFCSFWNLIDFSILEQHVRFLWICFPPFFIFFFVFILRSHFILKSFHLYCPYEVNLWDIYELDLSKFIRVKKEERTLRLQRENKVEHPPPPLS